MVDGPSSRVPENKGYGYPLRTRSGRKRPVRVRASRSSSGWSRSSARRKLDLPMWWWRSVEAKGHTRAVRTANVCWRTKHSTTVPISFLGTTPRCCKNLRCSLRTSSPMLYETWPFVRWVGQDDCGSQNVFSLAGSCSCAYGTDWRPQPLGDLPIAPITWVDRGICVKQD